MPTGKRRNILYAFTICFISGSIIGLYLNYITGGNVILILGAIGVFLGIFYTAKPFRIGYGSLGELAVGIGFGPLMVMGSYYVQAQALQFKTFLISIPIGILIALVLYINEFPDYEGDRSVGKRTLVVILGKKNAVILYHLLLASVYLIIIALVISRQMPKLALLSFLTIPLALRAYLISKNNFDKILELLPANAGTIGLHSLIGLLVISGYILDKLI